MLHFYDNKWSFNTSSHFLLSQIILVISSELKSELVNFEEIHVIRIDCTMNNISLFVISSQNQKRINNCLLGQ